MSESTLDFDVIACANGNLFPRLRAGGPRQREYDTTQDLIALNLRNIEDISSHVIVDVSWLGVDVRREWS